MRNYKDSQVVSDENCSFCLAALSALGDRKEQQDDFGYVLKSEEGIIVICDGMGGHDGGNLASNMAVDCFLTNYEKSYPVNDQISFLRNYTIMANHEILKLKGENGKRLDAGSTLVTVIVQKRNLYWSSVGDSRLYLFRNGEFVQITQDHNYSTVLKEKLKAGLIDENEFIRENQSGEALISYLGMAASPLIDYNESPLLLQSEDRLLLMSDGLYKVLSDEEILSVVVNFNNVSETAQALELKARKKAKNHGIIRDNMTIAVLKIN